MENPVQFGEPSPNPQHEFAGPLLHFITPSSNRQRREFDLEVRSDLEPSHLEKTQHFEGGNGLKKTIQEDPIGPVRTGIWVNHRKTIPIYVDTN